MNTIIQIDLSEELEKQELESFQAQAEEHGMSITEYFRELFLNPSKEEEAAA